jgi:hypothetical protein
LDEANTLMDQNKLFEYYNALNLFLPENIPEMNLRLKFLWGATTKIHTMAMEGGKRRTCAIWNDLDHYMHDDPVQLFFDSSKIKKFVFDHRKTPDSDPIIPALDELRKKFYSRAGKPITCHLHCCNDDTPYFTDEMVKKIREQSQKEAEYAASVQTKSVNDYLAEMIDHVRALSVVCSVTIPSENERKARKQTYEKTPTKHAANLGRYLIEVWAKLAKDKKNNERLATLFLPWDNAASKALQRLYNEEDDFYASLRAETKDAKSNAIVLKGFVNKGIEQRKTNKWYYEEKEFNPLILMEPTQLPTERNAQNAADPNTIDFFWAFRCSTQRLTIRAQPKTGN